MKNSEKAKEIAWNDSLYNDNQSCAEQCFIAALQMAEWKDKNPSVETIKKIIVYALTRTNIILADDLVDGVEWELLIKKALE